MNFNTLKSVITQMFDSNEGNLNVPFITGCPGGGKSACARAVAQYLKDKYCITDDRIVEFNPSLRDPCDIMGLPFRSEDGTHSEWLPPQEFYAIRSGVGPAVLIIEELSDASMQMQNPLCRVILDRYAGNLKLSEQLFIIATGNRVEDKSGANRLSTKLGNRMCILPFDTNVEDWADWATAKGLPKSLVQFIRFRPGLLNGFDPKRAVNPTPRSWEAVGRTPIFKDDKDMTIYQMTIGGYVGDGAAAEYVGYMRIVDKLPDFTKLIKDPEDYPVSKDLSVAYATIMKLVDVIANKKTKIVDVEAIIKFLVRNQPEMKAMAWSEITRTPEAFSKVKRASNLLDIIDGTVDAIM